MTSEDAPMLDVGHFNMMTGDDRALQAEIVALFRGQVDQWRTGLRAGQNAQFKTAHTIKGAARGIGLWRLADACETVETVDRAKAGEAIACALALLDVAVEELAVY
jgi:HPt (histidine-containing phosphotransfer) domain-containing protein